MKILLGVLLGIGFTVFAYFMFQNLISKRKEVNQKSEFLPTFKELITPNKSSVEDKVAIASLDEKINSLNTRIDDLYIFGGIIITLLLAINVGIFVNAQSEVDKFFKENYDSYLVKIKKASEESHRILGELQTKFELTLKAREIRGPNQTSVENGNDNEEPTA